MCTMNWMFACALQGRILLPGAAMFEMARAAAACLSDGAAAQGNEC